MGPETMEHSAGEVGRRQMERLLLWLSTRCFILASLRGRLAQRPLDFAFGGGTGESARIINTRFTLLL